MSTLVRAAACMVAVLAVARVASPCVCAELGPFEKQVRDASAVFLGRVVRLELTASAAGGDDMIATIRVERRWKGPRARELQVKTCGTQVMICTCGVDFQLGERYLVVAAGKPLETSICYRTTLAVGSDEEIRALEAMRNLGSTPDNNEQRTKPAQALEPRR